VLRPSVLRRAEALRLVQMPNQPSSHVQMEEFGGRAEVRIQPILGIASEPFDAVDVVAAERAPLLPADHNVLAPGW
jgi:hypothetical protein